MADITFKIKKYNNPSTYFIYTASEDITWESWINTLIPTLEQPNTWKYKIQSESGIYMLYSTIEAETWFFATTDLGPQNNKVYDTVYQIRQSVKGLSVLGAGGGGTGSDDCTATVDCVLKYLPGSLTEPSTAIVFGSDDDPIQGSIESKGYDQDAETGLITIHDKNYFHNAVTIDPGATYPGIMNKPQISIDYSSKPNTAIINSSCTISKSGVISKQTKYANAKSVQASDLVQGNYDISTYSATGYDVTNFATATVKEGSTSATASITTPKATIAKTSSGNVSSGTSTTTKPSSGYYIAHKANIPKTTISVKNTYTTGFITTGTATDGTMSAKDGDEYYTSITGGAISATAAQTKAGTASISAKNFTPATSSDYYVELSTSAGSAKATAKCSNDGYITTSAKAENSINIDVSGNGNKIYIPVFTW